MVVSRVARSEMGYQKVQFLSFTENSFNFCFSETLRNSI